MAQYEHLPIYKAAFDLLVYFGKIVRNFSRYNKYTHGTALRDLPREILMLTVRANTTDTNFLHHPISLFKIPLISLLCIPRYRIVTAGEL